VRVMVIRFVIVAACRLSLVLCVDHALATCCTEHQEHQVMAIHQAEETRLVPCSSDGNDPDSG
jgi:hypothetical protein